MIPKRHLYAAVLAAMIGAATPIDSARAATVSVSTVQAAAAEVTFEVADIPGLDERGVEGNAIRDVFVGAGAYIYSLRWQVNLTSNPGSYLSEMQLTFSDTLGQGVTFTPGGGDDFDGTQDYAGFQDLRTAGLAFQVGGDGILRLEFHDAYKDLPFDEPEGLWNFGTLTFGVSAVPEPQSCLLVAGGLLWVMVFTARRRETTPPRIGHTGR